MTRIKRKPGQEPTLMPSITARGGGGESTAKNLLSCPASRLGGESTAKNLLSCPASRLGGESTAKNLLSCPASRLGDNFGAFIIIIILKRNEIFRTIL